MSKLHYLFYVNVFEICSTFEMVTEHQTQSCVFIFIFTFRKHKRFRGFVVSPMYVSQPLLQAQTHTPMSFVSRV